MLIKQDNTHMFRKVTASNSLNHSTLKVIKDFLAEQTIHSHLFPNNREKVKIYIIVNNHLPIVLDIKLLSNHTKNVKYVVVPQLP